MPESEDDTRDRSQVAEEALPASGPPLEWSRGDRHVTGKSAAQGFRLVYLLVSDKDRQAWRIGYKRPHAMWLWLKSNGQWEPHPTVAPGCTRYPSLAAAKAACEQHYVTGKWKP